MKKNKIITFLVSCLLLIVAFSASAQGCPPGVICLFNPLGGVGNFPDLIDRIAKFIFNIVGLLAVIMFLWAGILFLTSAGSETQLGKAKKALVYAVIGLAISISGTILIALIKWILGAGG